MATTYPFPGVPAAAAQGSADGRGRRPRSGERLRWMVFNTLALGAIAGAPLATVALWLLLTNPVVAGEVAGSGSLFSVARVLLITLGNAIAAVLSLL